jgi:hypothetical protein
MISPDYIFREAEVIKPTSAWMRGPAASVITPATSAETSFSEGHEHTLVDLQQHVTLSSVESTFDSTWQSQSQSQYSPQVEVEDDSISKDHYDEQELPISILQLFCSRHEYNDVPVYKMIPPGTQEHFDKPHHHDDADYDEDLPPLDYLRTSRNSPHPTTSSLSSNSPTPSFDASEGTVEQAVVMDQTSSFSYGHSCHPHNQTEQVPVFQPSALDALFCFVTDTKVYDLDDSNALMSCLQPMQGTSQPLLSCLQPGSENQGDDPTEDDPSIINKGKENAPIETSSLATPPFQVVNKFDAAALPAKPPREVVDTRPLQLEETHKQLDFAAVTKKKNPYQMGLREDCSDSPSDEEETRSSKSETSQSTTRSTTTPEQQSYHQELLARPSLLSLDYSANGYLKLWSPDLLIYHNSTDTRDLIKFNADTSPIKLPRAAVDTTPLQLDDIRKQLDFEALIKNDQSPMDLREDYSDSSSDGETSSKSAPSQSTVQQQADHETNSTGPSLRSLKYSANSANGYLKHWSDGLTDTTDDPGTGYSPSMKTITFSLDSELAVAGSVEDKVVAPAMESHVYLHSMSEEASAIIPIEVVGTTSNQSSSSALHCRSRKNLRTQQSMQACFKQIRSIQSLESIKPQAAAPATTSMAQIEPSPTCVVSEEDASRPVVESSASPSNIITPPTTTTNSSSSSSRRMDRLQETKRNVNKSASATTTSPPNSSENSSETKQRRSGRIRLLQLSRQARNHRNGGGLAN